MQTLYNHLSPEEVDIFIDTVRNGPARQGPHKISAGTLPVASKVAKKKSSLATFRKSAKNGRAMSVAPAPAKRPLNSWMAFRSYYSPIFADLQQKEVSGILKELWEADPFKAKWAILAKAYSIIRDQQGRENSPLDVFLAIAGPLIGIIGADKYLGCLGWDIIMDDGCKKAKRSAPGSFDDHLHTTNLSAEDIVSLCKESGYAKGNDLSAMNNAGTNPALTMASRPAEVQTETSNSGPFGAGAFNSEAFSNPTSMNADTPLPTWVFDIAAPLPAQRLGNTFHTGLTPNPETCTFPEHNSDNAREHLDHQAIKLWESDSEYPFNDQFQPHQDGLGLLFEPNGSSHDAYDISGTNFDKYFGAN